VNSYFPSGASAELPRNKTKFTCKCLQHFTLSSTNEIFHRTVFASSSHFYFPASYLHMLLTFPTKTPPEVSSSLQITKGGFPIPLAWVTLNDVLHHREK
jgi:hypothetical protein